MIYSNKELESVAETIIRECEQEYFEDEHKLNIELFIEKKLNLDLEYKSLNTNEIAILIIEGITYFLCEDEEYEEITDQSKLSEEKLISVSGKTIIINQNSDINITEGGLRFSLAHEASHWILHKEYSKEFIKENNLEKSIEKEANFLADALLMPKSKFVCLLEKFGNLKGKEQEVRLAKIFGVSKEAVNIRIRNIMNKNNEEVTQKCEGKVKKAKQVNKSSVFNQELSFKITDDFQRNAKIYSNNIDPNITKLFNRIKLLAEEQKIDAWKIANLINIPRKIAQMYPHFCIFASEDKKVFYSLKDLSCDELKRINYKILQQIQGFINLNKEKLQGIDTNINELTNLESKEISLFSIDTESDKIFENVVKAKILFDITKNKFKWTPDRKEKELTELKLCYNATQGIEVMSEVKVSGDERFVLVIGGMIVERSSELYFEPKISVRNFVHSLSDDLNIGTQFRSESGKSKNLNRTIFIACGNKYISGRIKRDKEGKHLTWHHEDYYVFREIEDTLDISMEDIENALLKGEKREEILFPYHTSMGMNNELRLKSGIHTNDMRAVMNHIDKICGGLKLIDGVPACKVSNKKISLVTSVAVNQVSLNVSKAAIKNKKNEFDLYIFRGNAFKTNVYEKVIKFFDENLKKGLTKIGENRYVLEFFNKQVVFNIKDILDDRIVGRKISEDEDSSNRREFIKKIITGNNKAIALLEIEYLNKNKYSNMKLFDVKSILREALNELGILNQFVIGDTRNELSANQEKGYESKVANSILDLFNDLGIVNAYSCLENKVVYSFLNYKAKNDEENNMYFIIRADEEKIEFMPSDGPEQIIGEWHCISDKNRVLFEIQSKINAIGSIEKQNEADTLQEIIDIINEDNREKIVILSHENGFENEWQKVDFGQLIDASVVKTKLTETELIQFHKEDKHTGITTCIYKVDEKLYKSNGEKVNGMKQNASVYKIDNPTNGYKHRNLMEINILNNKIEEDVLAEIIHRLRVPVTTEIHMNKDIYTEHLIDFKETFISKRR